MGKWSEVQRTVCEGLETRQGGGDLADEGRLAEVGGTLPVGTLTWLGHTHHSYLGTTARLLALGHISTLTLATHIVTIITITT